MGYGSRGSQSGIWLSPPLWMRLTTQMWPRVGPVLFMCPRSRILFPLSRGGEWNVIQKYRPWANGINQKKIIPFYAFVYLLFSVASTQPYFSSTSSVNWASVTHSTGLLVARMSLPTFSKGRGAWFTGGRWGWAWGLGTASSPQACFLTSGCRGCLECLWDPRGPALLRGKLSNWSRWSNALSPGPQVRPGHFGEKNALCRCNRLVAKVALILHTHPHP